MLYQQLTLAAGYTLAVREEAQNQVLPLDSSRLCDLGQDTSSLHWISPVLKTKTLDSAIRILSQNAIIIYDLMAMSRKNVKRQNSCGHHSSLDIRESILARDQSQKCREVGGNGFGFGHDTGTTGDKGIKITIP